jgi:hypothetical protein
VLLAQANCGCHAALSRSRSIASCLTGNGLSRVNHARRLVSSSGGDGLSFTRGLVILPFDAPGRRSGSPWHTRLVLRPGARLLVRPRPYNRTPDPG